jgi:hypothetical protein
MKKFISLFAILLCLGQLGTYAADVLPTLQQASFIAFYGGSQNNGKPEGEGSLKVMNKAKKAKLYDEILGTFKNDTVKNATLTMYGGPYFKGTLWYEYMDKTSESAGYITYHLLEGTLNGLDEEVTVKPEDGVAVSRDVHYKTGEFTLQPFDVTLRKHTEDAQYEGCQLTPVIQKFLQCKSGTIESKATINGRIMTKEDKNKIAASNFFGDGSKRYVYFCRLDNGAIVDYDGNVWTITMPNGSYIAFEDSNDGKIKSINWIYQDGVLCLHTYTSDEIVYNDGRKFTGVFLLKDYIKPSKYKSSDLLFTRFVAKNAKSLSELSIEYVDGTETKLSGEKVEWTDRFNKKLLESFAANGDKLQEVKAKEQAIERKKNIAKWDAAKAGLIQRFGANYVNKIYNYQLEKGMPLALFQALNAQLPYVSCSPAIYATNDIYKRKTILFIMEDRQTGVQRICRELNFDIYDRLK